MSDEPAQTIAEIHECAHGALHDAWTLLHANREAFDPLELARAYTAYITRAEDYVNRCRSCCFFVVSFGNQPDADDAKAGESTSP
jgi:hypothetical protein